MANFPPHVLRDLREKIAQDTMSAIIQTCQRSESSTDLMELLEAATSVSVQCVAMTLEKALSGDKDLATKITLSLVCKMIGLDPCKVFPRIRDEILLAQAKAQSHRDGSP